MSIFSAIGNFFHSLFDKAGALLKKLWVLASPFLKEMLSLALQEILKHLQELALEAVAYIDTKGLPTDKAKQDAFATYMRDALKKEGKDIKDSELNLLRETAVAIYKKIKEQA